MKSKNINIENFTVWYSLYHAIVDVENAANQNTEYRYFIALGRVLQEKLDGSVRPASQNPYPIYDQNLRNSFSYL